MAANKKTGGSLPWGLKEEKLKPNSVEELSKEKLKAFSIGTANSVMLRKSVIQKKKEEKQVKKELETKETAKVFEDFVATFDESEHTTKTFVRGNVINPEDKDEASKTVGSVYQLQPSKFLKSALEKKPNKEPLPPISTQQKPSKKKSKSNEKKKSMLEMFGEELKKMQEERTEHYSSKKSSSSSNNNEPLLQQPSEREQLFKAEDYDLPKGSIDSVDPMTTNLYVGNINPKMTEEMMCQHFGKFGPLASIKIMWPRTEEEISRNKNCGFVAFMKRKDAEKALEAMKGSSIMSYEVQIGWGKTVPLPPKPFYVAPTNEKDDKMDSSTRTGLPFNAKSLKSSSSQYSTVPPPSSGAEAKKPEGFDEVLYNSIIKVIIPSDTNTLCLIHRMIEFIIREGPMFEAMIMNKEIANPDFKFLFENTSPEHIYYRWKLFSILQGDSPETWRTEEFRMFEGGSLWRPPPLKNLRGKVMPPIMEIVKKGQLASDLRDSLEHKLRSITMERSKVREVMVWCIDHSDSAEEVSDCLCESLSLTETPLPLKMARLYLVNDILQNTNARHASIYRRILEGKLIALMEHFHDILRGIESRIRAESFKKRVLKCLQALDQLSVYHFDYVDKLREIFIGKTQEELEKKKAFETVAALMSTSRVESPPPVAMDEGPPPSLIDDDRPIDFSGRGFTVVGGGGGIDEDLDGVPLNDDADIDGVPMDEDIDGIPMSEPVPAAAPPPPPVVKSKWELVENESSDEEKEQEESGQSSSYSGGTSSKKKQESLKEQQKRQFLRDVEVKVLELVEALESSGTYTASQITEKASKFRQKLLLEGDSGGPTTTTITTVTVTDKSSSSETSKTLHEQSESSRSKTKTDKSHEVTSKHSGSDSSSNSSRRRSRSPRKRKHSSPSSRKKSPDHSRRRSRSPQSSSSSSSRRPKSPSHSSSHRHRDRHRSRSPHKSSSSSSSRNRKH